MRSENFQKTSGSKGASPSIQGVTHPREEPTQSTWSERGREGKIKERSIWVIHRKNMKVGKDNK